MVVNQTGAVAFTAARRAVNFERECMLTLVGIFMVVVVALLSNKEQRKGAWLLAAVVIVLVLIVDWMR
jgi:cell division protein FtsW (lipid II flippase)